MTDKKYKYWLAVVDGQLVQFSDLAHILAIAMHPEGGEAYGLSRVQFDNELKQAVHDGVLNVRNPSSLGIHTTPQGDTLQRAVLIPDTDLEPFLNARGIELRITPHGNGPDYWTLENAAAAMQEQLKWHDGTRAEFQDQMQEAAASGALVVLNPRTCLPYRPERVRTYWEYVTAESVNTWLATLKAPYRWSPTPPLVTLPHKSPRDSKPWEMLMQVYAPINGLYMYQQAAREIADAERWDDSKLEALEAEMISAINDGSLPKRSRKTGMVIAPDVWSTLSLVTVDDVNLWLEKKGVRYRWALQTNTPQPQAAPAQEAVTPAPVVSSPKLTTKRRKRRTWRDVALPYVVDIFKTGDFTTAKALFLALEKKAGSDSPFELGTGENRAKLVVRELCETVSLKTIQNAWDDIKALK